MTEPRCGHEHQGELPNVATCDVVWNEKRPIASAPVWVTQVAKAKRAPIPSTQRKAARTPARDRTLSPSRHTLVVMPLSVPESNAGDNQHRDQTEIVATQGYGGQVGDARPGHQSEGVMESLFVENDRWVG